MINGAILLDGCELQAAVRFSAVNPSTGKAIGGRAFSSAAAEHVDRACTSADNAFEHYYDLAPRRRAQFLEAIADAVEADGEALVETAHEETGLAITRLKGERMRTVNQLRLFARVVKEGRWINATVDSARPERQPLPRVDLRMRRMGIGPVAVFGASNFPLAFSVAGGDTAAALAAGCPVIVKGHPAHPGTGELAARAVVAAAAGCGLPGGVFSYLPGADNALGAALVADPRVKAVAFTGSRAGGLALAAITQQRREPIPVFAEMSSVNPVVLLPAALAGRAEAIAEKFIESMTLGAGQFCTNPGVIFLISGAGGDRFERAAAAHLAAVDAAPMLTQAILDAYARGSERLAAHTAVERVATGGSGAGATALLFATTGTFFRADPSLRDELFGAASLIVRCRDVDDLRLSLAAMDGQLTASMHVDEDDMALARSLLPLLERKAGRLLVNDWPTGVEVTHAMVHGGPFPATTDGRWTSVGVFAIERFLRPVCYQSFPEALLPHALGDTNVWSVPRVLDGRPSA